MLPGAGVDESVEGDGARLSVRVKETGDPLGAVAQPVSPLAIARGRVEAVANDRPAIQGDRLRDGPIEDVAGDPLDMEATADGISAVDRVQVCSELRVPGAKQRDGPRLRLLGPRRIDVAGNAFGLEARHLEVQDDQRRGVVDAGENPVFLERRDSLDDLGVELTAELVRLSGGDPRHDVVEVLAQKLRQRAGQPLELLAADILDGDVEFRRTVNPRFDVDPHPDLEPETPPASVVISPRQRAGDRGAVLAIDQAPDHESPRSRLDRDQAAAMDLTPHLPCVLERQRWELLDQAGEVLAVELHLGRPRTGRSRTRGHDREADEQRNKPGETRPDHRRQLS